MPKPANKVFPIVVLVLTSSTGSGHDKRAMAFKEWVEKLYGSKVNVHIEQIIENASPLGRFGVWVYNFIQKHWPALHNLYFFIVELIIMTQSSTVTLGGTYYRKLLKSLRPDVIFSVHDSTNRGYFEDAKRILGPKVRCVTYCGEFFGGYGYSRNWVNKTADLFIARTHPSLDHAIKLGIKRKNAVVFHKFLPPRAFEPLINKEDFPQLREALGLNETRFTLFLATGGFGANHHLKFLRELLPLQDKIQVIAVCGQNEKTFLALNEWKNAHPDFLLFVEGYSHNIAKYLQISHAVVTRGGANTTMEALHFECPILYNSLGGLMPQELCTVRYFEKHHAAKLIKKTSDLPKYLEKWIHFDDSYLKIKSSLARLNPQELPHYLIRLILGEKI